MKRAFTLLEIIIAIALSGILLATAAGTIVNSVNIWEKSENIATLDRHLAGLVRFLTRICEEQETTQIANSGMGGSVVGATWGNPPGRAGVMAPQFSIKEIYPILQTGEFPSPVLTAWLFWDADGLWLIAQTPRQKLENENLASTILLSPYCIAGTIQSLDAATGAWETIDAESASQNLAQPARLVLKFRQNQRERELTIALSKIAVGGVVY